MSEAPIIILGAARSGTKFLRDVLASAKGVSAVPYDVNYVWRYGAGDVLHDVLDPEALTDRRRAFIRKTLPSLAGLSAGEVLVEKTVSNTLRVPFVNRVYPEARFIHLLRDGRDVAESAMGQWQSPPDWSSLMMKLRGMPLANLGYVFWFAGNFIKGKLSGRGGGSVWGPRFPGIEGVAKNEGLAAVCARQWVESVTATERGLAGIEPERVVTIRYEDLVRDEVALRDLCSAVGIADVEGVVAAWRSRVRLPGKPRWPDLPKVDRATFERIMGPTLKAQGY